LSVLTGQIGVKEIESRRIGAGGFSNFVFLSFLGISRSILGAFKKEGFESLKESGKPGLKSEDVPKGPTARGIQVI